MLGREIRAINKIQRENRFEKYACSYNNIPKVLF